MRVKNDGEAFNYQNNFQQGHPQNYPPYQKLNSFTFKQESSSSNLLNNSFSKQNTNFRENGSKNPI